MELLGVSRADIEPNATDHIEEMIETISGLIDKGYAYPVDGDVYFEVVNSLVMESCPARISMISKPGQG